MSEASDASSASYSVVSSLSTVGSAATASSSNYALRGSGESAPASSLTSASYALTSGIFARLIDAIVGLAAPVLVTLGGATQPNTSPGLDWGDVSQAASYILQYDTNASFTNPVETTGITDSEFTFTQPLADDTYFWRVKAVGSGGEEGGYSATDSFAIIPTFTEWVVILLALAMAAYLICRVR